MDYVQCPICQIDNSRPFIPFGPKDIIRCRQCGLVYVNPRRPPELISSFFEDKYISDQKMLHREFGTWRFDSLRREADFVKSAMPLGRILDIGCAGGEFLSLFSEKDWSRYGIDPSHTAVRHAKSRGIKVYQGVLQTAHLDCPDAYFNVIASLDTVFLSPTPVEDLRRIHRLLASDGIFVVEIPGYVYRMLKNIGPVSLVIYRQWCHFSSVSPHLYYYSDLTFRKLLKLCGFKLEKILLEQSPVRGSSFMVLINRIYFIISRIIYKITLGRLNLAGKVVYLCKKI